MNPSPSTPARARASRRLRFRSRSTAVTVALIALSILAAYVAVEAVLALVGQPSLLDTPFALLARVAGSLWATVVAVAVLTLAGVFAIGAAVLPGRFRRRLIRAERLDIVVDDDVFAAGVSRAVANDLGVDRTQVRTALGRRRGSVRITPTSGFPVSAAKAQSAADALIQQAAATPAPRVSTVVERTGVMS